MRKNVIALSVAAFVGGLGMATGAMAAVFPDLGPGAPGTPTEPTDAAISRQALGGTGHQLFLPYFNVQNGNATLLNIVNTDTINAKAVKVRFRGGSNSDDVFDFTLFMSPGDVWAAQLSRGSDGITRLSTPDKSCTLPSAVGKDNGGANSTFVLARLPNTFLTGDNLARETREGYVEIFNMADIPPNAIDPATGNALAGANPLFTAVKHVNGVAPCTSAVLNTLQTDLTSTADAYSRGFRGPTTGLFGNWTIVNVPKAGTATGEFRSVTAVRLGGPTGTTEIPARGNIVFFPQVAGAVANPDNFTADPSLRTLNVVVTPANPLPLITAQFFDLPDISTPYLLLCTNNNGPTAAGACIAPDVPRAPVPADPIGYVTNLQASLATFAITNEFLTDPNIAAFTDWVMSSPTRRYNIAADYRPLNATTNAGRAVLTPNAFYTTANTSIAANRYQICTATNGVTFFDREETGAQGTQFVVSPNTPAAAFSLCGETSVLTFNAATGASVLGAEIARTNLATTGANGLIRDGWAIVQTLGIGNGLPLVGKAYVSASTSVLNVGGSWEHRYQLLAP